MLLFLSAVCGKDKSMLNRCTEVRISSYLFIPFFLQERVIFGLARRKCSQLADIIDSSDAMLQYSLMTMSDVNIRCLA